MTARGVRRALLLAGLVLPAGCDREAECGVVAERLGSGGGGAREKRQTPGRVEITRW